MQSSKKQYTKPVPFVYDKWILFTVIALIAFGLVMVASSSMVISDQQFGYPFHYLVKQSIFLSIAFIIAFFVTRVPSEVWKKYSLILLGVGIFLLIAVLIPGVGQVINGSRRWLNFGFIGFQVSEVVKLCAIAYLASYVERFQDQIQEEWMGFIKPMLLLGVIAFFLLLEPDFGAVVVLTTVFVGVLFLANARIWPFLLLLLIVASLLGLLAVISPYRMARLTAFLHPWEHAYDSGYQLTQSLIAFGRGGWFGVGLGNSIQKLFYLPEAHSDFIFAVISEELGFVGEIALLGLFTVLVWRLFKIAKHAMAKNQVLSSYFCYGVAFWIAFQVVVNIGVCSGLLPTKGLTLPFISYGGSSILVNCIVMGIVLRIAHEVSV